MKCLFCEDCGDIIAPLPKKLEPRLCNCERHAVWWLDPERGVIRVCDLKAKEQAARFLRATEGKELLPADQILREMASAFAGAPNGEPRCWLLGITNLFLHFKLEGLGRSEMNAGDIERIIDAHDDSYLFKRQRSAVVRFRPGQTGDSAWSDVPDFADRQARIH